MHRQRKTCLRKTQQVFQILMKIYVTKKLFFFF